MYLRVLVVEQPEADESIFRKRNSRILQKLADIALRPLCTYTYICTAKAARITMCVSVCSHANMLLIPIYVAVFLLAAAPPPSVRTRSNTMTSAV